LVSSNSSYCNSVFMHRIVCIILNS
jgi:hypothetical protein